MAGQTTYRDLFQLVSEEIAKRQQFQGTKTFRNQLDRNDVGPLLTNPISDVRASEIITSVQNLLTEALPGFIIEGLNVTQTDPISNQVKVTAGKGSKGGFLYQILSDTTVPVPFDSTTQVFFISLFRDRILIEKNERLDALTLAKVIVPEPSRIYEYGNFRIYDDKTQREDEIQPYIQTFRDFKLYADINGKLEEDSLEALRGNIGPVLADNLIGNIRLSENLKVINTQGTLELDSKAIKLYNSNGDITAKFNKDGTFYYNSDGVEIARFAVDGAKIGNIVITPNSIQSENFVSGALGAGFQILDTGDAEFNNIRARGKLTTSVFEKDTISSVGGSFLVMDSDILDEDMTALDASTLKISGDTTFAVNDILRIKDGIDDEWLTVTASNGGNYYTVNRDRASQYSADSNPAWTKGTAVVNYGASGEGGIFMTSSESNSPYMSILTHAGSPWSATTTHLRLGNLNGFLGYVTDAYGIGIGTTNCYLKYDPVNGLQIKGSITVTGGNAAVTFYQDAEPSGQGEKEGDFWVDTNDSNKLYTYISGNWELAQSLGTGVTTFCQGSLVSGQGIPTSVNTGDVWYDTSTNKLYRASAPGANEVSGTEWALMPTAGTDDNGNLITSVIPGCSVATPSGAGLYLGSDYMGYYSGSQWKAFIQNNGNFFFCGDGSNFLSWNGTAVCLRGRLNADDIVAGSMSACRICAGFMFLDNGITIKTRDQSGSNARTEFDGTSFRTYDNLGCKSFEICDGAIKAWDYTQSGNPQTLSIEDGLICAQQLRLQDPSCICCYSFLDAGALKFHDELGDVPYVKRICNGEATSGTWVCLRGWRDVPKVIVSIKNLNAYDAGFAAQDQRWNVYSSDCTFYCESGLNYGYCFKVNAALELAAGAGSECVKNAGFDPTKVYTLANTCATFVKHRFRFFCHGAAPANWCYGCFCWKLCYRLFGSGTWCQTATQFYLQPHTNTTEMQTCYDCTICFNWGASSGPAGCWELMGVQVGTTLWVDSGIASGSTVTGLATRALGTALVCSDANISAVVNSTTGVCSINDTDQGSISVAGSTPSGICTVYCAYACWCWISVTPHLCCNMDFFQCCSGFTLFCTRPQACVRSPYSTMQSRSGVNFCECIGASSEPSSCCTCSGTCSWVLDTNCTNLDAFANCTFPNMCLCTSACALLCRNYSIASTACIRTISHVCFCGGNLFQCYCYSSGDAEGDSTFCIHSICDVLDTACVLDSTGVLNWLAIAYS